MGQHAVDFGHDIHAIHQDRPVGAVAQGDVQDRALFGVVVFRAAEHRGNFISQVRLLRQIEQQRQGRFGDAILRVVEQNVAQLQ